MDQVPRGAWGELICTMDETGVMNSSTADLQADDSFHHEVRTRLLSIETKLDNVVKQFLNHGCLASSRHTTLGTTSSHHSPLGRPAEKTVGWDIQPEQQSTLPTSFPQVTLPCAYPNETETDETEALPNVVRAPRAAREEKPRSEGSQTSSRGLSSSSSSDSWKQKLATPHVPHVELDRGATWMREDSEGSLAKRDTIERLNHMYGFRSTIKRFTQIQGKPTEEALEQMKRQRLWSFVHSSSNRAVSSSMVILNVAFTAALTEVELWNAAEGHTKSTWWGIGNIIFCLYFLAEIGLRFMAEKRLFFNGPHFRWNIFDTLVVILSVMDVVLDLSGDAQPTQNIVIARVLRFSRLLRIMSVARIMRACQSLRLVVLTILESISSLAWCFLVLGIIIFTFAIFVVQGVTAQLRSQDVAVDGGTVQQLALRATLLELFGGVPVAAISLFMMVSGGVDWKDAMLPMKQVNDFYEYFFTFYVFFMTIGVLNVVVGAFVTATGEIASRDRDLMVKAEMHQLTTYLEKVRTFFSEADVDKSGKLSLEEFKAHLDDKLVCAYFHALGVDVSQAEQLFHLLDGDGSRMLGHNEFIAGCMRLRGPAKSLDVNLLLHEHRQLSRRFALLRDEIETQRAACSDAQSDV